MDRKRLGGRIGLFAVTIIWGSSFAMNDVAMQVFTPHQLLALRFTIAFLLMLLLMNQKLKALNWAVIKKGMVLGTILYISYVLQTVALLYTTPSKNAFLTSFNVVLVPLISGIFFKTKVSKPAILGAITSFVGVSLISFQGFSHMNLGDLMTLCCAVFFALHIIYTSQFASTEDPMALNTIQMGTTAALACLVALIIGDPWDWGNPVANGSTLYLAVFCTMAAYLLQTASQKYTKHTETAIILSLESFFGMIFSMIIVHEVMTLRMVLGGGLILLGVLMVEVLGQGPRLEANPQETAVE